MAGLNPVGLGILQPGLTPGGGAYALAPRRNAAQENIAFFPGNSDEGAANPGVIVSISDEGFAASRQLGGENKETPGGTELTEEEQREVDRLEQRDQEVRRHEQAHVSAGGQYVRGGPTFELTRGPDGKQYATGGEVSIDTGAEKTPEATIAKARIVKRAALAPADPSSQDRRVAAQASQLEASARKEINKRRTESTADGSANAKPDAPKQDSPLDTATPAASGVQALKFDQRI
ncbi:MAG: hypothetical protein GC168_04715 [Candidatus Hydrogenedens sp.]|nr:hypothetical protein [Candidatus Hydrogenedens sp.]